MRTKKAWMVQMGLFLAAFAATASFATDVKTDYDHGVNFGRYTTYSWGDVRTEDSHWVDRIKSEVNAAVADRGWTQVPAGGAISIAATEINRNHRRFLAHNRSTSAEDRYETDALEIDLFDTKTNNLIWRGSVTDTLSNNSDSNLENFDKGIQKMFKHFPPEAKK